jgi:hypothetical protein
MNQDLQKEYERAEASLRAADEALCVAYKAYQQAAKAAGHSLAADYGLTVGTRITDVRWHKGVWECRDFDIGSIVDDSLYLIAVVVNVKKDGQVGVVEKRISLYDKGDYVVVAAKELA